MTPLLLNTTSTNFDDARKYFLLGLDSARKECFEDAENYFYLSLNLMPERLSTLTNLSIVLIKLGKYKDAYELLNKLISLSPLDENLYLNNGNVLHELKKFTEAITFFNKAIHIKQDFEQAFYNRGNSLQELLYFDEALESYDKAIELNPQYADAHFNKSLLLLLLGDLINGFKEYEFRWLSEEHAKVCGARSFAEPLWLGEESISNKTILLYSEQGLGDTLQFCRYAKLVAALGAKVILEVDKSLINLLRNLEGVHFLIAKGSALPEFDFQCPLMSLPLAFKTEAGSIPGKEGYLKCDKEKTEIWSQRLGPKLKPRIGLVWSGSTIHKNDHNRSILLADLINHLPSNFDYISLQKEVRNEDKETLANSTIQNFGEQINDFSDTSALCLLMDLVVSVDTSVAHLAGALAKKTWLLLPYLPDWRWMLDRNDSPWYSNHLLLRQKKRGDWISVFKKVASELNSSSFFKGYSHNNFTSTYVNELLKQGVYFHKSGKIEQAGSIFERILNIDPHNFEALQLSGMVSAQNKQWAKSLSLLTSALKINQKNAVVFNNHGAVLFELKRYEEALVSYDKAIQINAAYPEAYLNRGNALKELMAFERAFENYSLAIKIKPNYFKAHNNLGNLQKKLNRFKDSLESYDQAILANPQYFEAYTNRANALQELLYFDEALESYDKAIELNPQYADAHFNKSLLLLLLGDLINGFKEYEFRWLSEEHAKVCGARSFAEPLWLGEESISNKTILLYSEQGLGDTLQFCRYAKLVAALGAKVILEVDKSLINLLRNLEGVHFLIAKGSALPEFDFQCPLMSLPLAFKTEAGSIPGKEGYLKCDKEKTEIWSQRLGPKLKPRIGLVWSGSTIHKNDHNRSILLADLINHLPSNFDYISLQKEVRNEDKETLANSTIQNFGEQINDFSDTSALCLLMDLVVSVDTSVAHLAGALAKKTWLLLPYLPDWRWMLDRNDSPWYSSFKLYRQDEKRQYTSIFSRLANDLIDIFNDNLNNNTHDDMKE